LRLVDTHHFGSDMIQVFKIPKETIQGVFVTRSGFETVGSVAARLPEYNFIINADGWYGSQSASIWYSEGIGKNTSQRDWRPWINFDKQNNYKFGWMWGTFWGNFNAVSGTRFIVENGQPNTRWEGWPTELNARTAIGIAYDGSLVVAVVDGRDSPDPEGLSLKGLADLMIENGCETAIDLDGGGSTTLAINGQIANTPEDDGVPGQRAVINHLCLRLSEIPGQPTDPPPVDPPPVSGHPEWFKLTDPEGTESYYDKRE